MAKLKALYVEYALALLLLVAGCVLTLTAAVVFQQHHKAKVHAAFTEAAQDRMQTIGGFLNYALFTLRSVDAFYQASADITEKEFTTFVKPLVDSNPYIRSVNWLPHITSKSRDTFEQALQADHPEFAVTARDGKDSFKRENGKNDYYPITYSYPPRQNSQGLGYDVTSDETRQDTIHAANKLRTPQASGLIEFLNHSDQQDLKGVVIFTPIFKSADAQANGLPDGYVSSTLSLRKLLDEAIKPLSRQGVHIVLTDLNAANDNERYLQTRSSRLVDASHDQIIASLANTDLMRDSDIIEFAGRKWEITIIQDAGFFSTKPSPTFYGILIGGMLFTALFSLYVASLSRAKERIRIQVLDRTAALNRAKRNTELILASTHEGIIGINRVGAISFCNPYAAKLLGYDKHTNLIGRDYHATIRPALNGNAIPRAQCHILNVLEDGTPLASAVYDFTRADDVTVPVDFTAAPVVDNDDVSGAVIIFRDIAERRASEQRLSHAAGHDQMTGLFNRRSFDAALESALARAQRSGRKCALLYMDLNGFKKINDELGHDAGDIMLKTFGQRLKLSMRDTDTIARLGGDEFAVICELLDSPVDCEAAINRLLSDISRTPVELAGKDYFLSSSIGMAMYPDNAHDSASLIKAADNAMYVAKKDKTMRYALAETQV